MIYKIVLFGTKDTTLNIAKYIKSYISDISLIVTIDEKVLEKNHIAGYSALDDFGEKNNIPIYKALDYSLNDSKTMDFFKCNQFDIGISMGWQRLIPEHVLNAFKFGIFGFHGSCGYLPFGRGRSPLNWSLINGDHRFIMNLFKYDEMADSPNVYKNIVFEINSFDTIKTLQYKSLIVSKRLIADLLKDYEKGSIDISKSSKDFGSWYPKRTPEDGKIDFKHRTDTIYNLIRGVRKPFPGAFCYNSIQEHEKVIIWSAVPFDKILDFSQYTPGEVVDIFDNNVIVRTVDGSLLIKEYQSGKMLRMGDVLL